MTDCIHCSKMWSSNCKQCPEHLAELAAFERRISNYIHHMARVIWRLQPDRSNLSETGTNMVSSAKHQPLTPMQEETSQAGHLSYPTTTFNSVPACNITPLAQSGQSGAGICSSRATASAVSSNLTGGFPVWFHSPRWEHGAGKHFFNKVDIIPPNPLSCVDYNYWRV